MPELDLPAVCTRAASPEEATSSPSRATTTTRDQAAEKGWLGKPTGHSAPPERARRPAAAALQAQLPGRPAGLSLPLLSSP